MQHIALIFARRLRALVAVGLAMACAGCGAAAPQPLGASDSQPGSPTAAIPTAVIPPAQTARSPAEQKIDSQLLAAIQHGGALPGVPVEPDGTLIVDITARVSDALLDKLRAHGATIISAQAELHALRARAPLDQLLAIAALTDVIFIRPGQQGSTDHTPSSSE